jgi:hypothetical protein
MASLGRPLDYRRQGVTMEKAERYLLSEINSLFEDAVEYVVISKSAIPANELLSFLHSTANRKADDAPLQASSPLPGTDVLDRNSIMKTIGPILVHLAQLSIKNDVPIEKISRWMANELQRLMDNQGELEVLTGVEFKRRESLPSNADDDGSRLN